MTMDKKLAEMENVMRLQTDVIADLNKQITDLREQLGLQTAAKQESYREIRIMQGETDGLRAANAVLTQEIESYRMDQNRLMSEMESESGEKR